MSSAPPSAFTSSPVAIGEILAGKYRVERILGVGGMGVVVAATHLTLEQLVALKFVLPSAVGDEIAIERFLREARAAVRLKSEHATKVLDVGKLDSGAPYMVMEYLEGQDLGNYIREKGSLSVSLTADLVIQACEALAEAHSLGIVHRDLKPQNLFITTGVGGREKVKVLDFGISKVTTPGFSKLTQTTSVMGSPLYMAPEQMRSSRNADVRIDVWALGVVIYELLTGQVPFEADTMPELCLKVVHDEPRSLRALRADVPDEVIAVISRCLQKDPANRYANAAEVAQALEPFASPQASEMVERARMAVSLNGPTRVNSFTPPESAMPLSTIVSAPSMAGPVIRDTMPAPGTQPTWGTTGPTPTPSRTPMVALTSIALVAIGVAIFFATRKPAAPPPAPAAVPVPTQAATTPSTASPVVTPVVTTAEPTAPVAVAPPPSASAAPAVVAPIRPTSRPKPSQHDDGIPSVR